MIRKLIVLATGAWFAKKAYDRLRAIEQGVSLEGDADVSDPEVARQPVLPARAEAASDTLADNPRTPVIYP